MVKSYRKLMATTRAVLRDTATIVRRLGHRVRTASPHIRPILQRAQEGLAAMRPRASRHVALRVCLGTSRRRPGDGDVARATHHRAILTPTIGLISARADRFTTRDPGLWLHSRPPRQRLPSSLVIDSASAPASGHLSSRSGRGTSDER